MNYNYRSNPLLICLLILCYSVGLHAQETDAAPSNIEPEIEITQDVVYGRKAGMALVYDVFTPPEPNGTTVVYMMSGGWFSLWTEPQYRVQWFESFLDNNITVISVFHGSSPQFFVPDAVDDVFRAIRHIRSNADELGINADKLVVMGQSAGGHLSLMLGLAHEQQRLDPDDPLSQDSGEVAAVIAVYPPVDLTGYVGPSDNYPALNFNPELAEGVSPIFFASEDDPPVLLIHGTEDTLVPIENSERMQRALTEVGVSTHLEIVEGAGHGFSRPADRQQQQDAIEKFLKEHDLLD